MRTRKIHGAQPGGRLTKRTPETADAICRAVAKGMPFNFACHIAGICLSSFHDWKAKDPAFREQIEAAIARGIEKRLAIIEEMAATDWRCCAWWLEHCQPQHFARNRLEISGPDGAPLTAGVQLYLPEKDNGGAVVECAEAPALAERNSDGNGG
jgi:hypothetical protein